LSILFHGFKFPEQFFNFLFFGEVGSKIFDEIFDFMPFVDPICLFDICINVKFLLGFCFSSIYVGEKELRFQCIIGKVLYIDIDIDVTVSYKFLKSFLVTIKNSRLLCMRFDLWVVN